MKIFQNVQNYFKYGKLVHKSPSGNTIRKNVAKSLFSNFDPDIETTKTVLNKNNEVIKTLNRRVLKTDNARFQLFNTECYNEHGEKILGKSICKEYEISKDKKKIIDYTKPNCDYKMEKLPNGKTKYEILYPEVTTIKNGEVHTSQKNKTYIA